MPSRPRHPFARTIGLCLFMTLFWVGAALVPAQAETPDRGVAAARSAIGDKVQETVDKIGEAVKRQVLQLAAHLDANPHLQLTVDSAFYDRKLRRVFIAVHGAATFTGRLGFPVRHSDYCFTSDDAIAYDLSLTQVKVGKGQITCRFSGDLVLFFDKILYETTRQAVDIGGGLALSALADNLLVFVHQTDMRLLAEALTKTLRNFSADSLGTTGAELIDNLIRTNRHRVADLVRGAVKSGGMGSFLLITIIKSSIGSAASLAGSSLGAVVGNVLVPGAGGVVGAFIGGKILGALSRMVVYEVTVEIPVKIALHKIVRAHVNPDDSLSGPNLTPEVRRNHEFVLRRVKRGIDNNHYKELDDTLKAMADFPADERPAFVPLLCQIKELLRYKTIDLGDWYGAKKYHQLLWFARENKLERWVH